MTIINFMNTYDMVLYWQNKALVMEREVRKAQKGIARLKRRERYLLENVGDKGKKGSLKRNYHHPGIDRWFRKNFEDTVKE